MPNEMKNWPGFIKATDQDWEVRNKYYQSEGYKKFELYKEKKEIEVYNKHFAIYGLTK